MDRSRVKIALPVVAGLLAAGLAMAGDQPTDDAAPTDRKLQEGYEGNRTSWQREYTDATVRLLAHDRTDRAAHSGRLSERFQFEAGPGSRFFVSEALPKVPITEDLGVSLYVRSSQRGAQLFGWVVLPADIDPETKAPSYLLIPGTVFNRPDRWEKLELTELVPAVQEQARVLRASTRRPVSLEGAYLARVVVNLLGGQGQSEVFLDDLEVRPVPPETAAAWTAERSRLATGGSAPMKREDSNGAGDTAGLPAFTFNRGVLEKLLQKERRYAPWFPTAIDAPGANPLELRRMGFDVYSTGPDPDAKLLRQAVEKGMFLLPRLAQTGDDKDARSVLKAMAAYPLPGAALLWSIGEHLGSQRLSADRQQDVQRIREILARLHEADEPRLATGTVDGEFRMYSRPPANLDVIGVDLPVWGTSETFMDGLQYLLQRRLITAHSNAETLFWGWLPATTPKSVIRNIWGTDEVPSWGVPPIQPEQLRLMTYMALAGGCRGLTYLGDSAITRPAGEALLIEMSFLNAEIDLFEEILARNVSGIADYKVFDPDPAERPTTANVNMKRMPLVNEQAGKAGLYAAAVPLVGGKGALVLLADLTGGSQWQPGQMAYHDLVIHPRLPQGVQFLEVSAGDAHFIEEKVDDRIPGGTRITIPDFGVSTLLLCTTDTALCERIQRQVRAIQPLAAQMAIRQADLQLASVREIHERLKADGHIINNEEELKKRRKRGIEGPPVDADDLVKKADDFMKAARAAYESEQYASAFGEARRASRPLRHLMAGYWNQAMAELTKAVTESFNGKKVEYPPGAVHPYPKPPVMVTGASCPPAISFYTLPQLHIWKDWAGGLPGYEFGPNLVPSGSFDKPQAILRAGWSDVSHQYAGIVRKITVPAREKAPREKEKPIPKSRRKADIRIKFAEEVVAPGDHVLMLSVEPEHPDEIDQLLPVLDYPAAAVRSPAIPVSANNLIRISVLVQRPMESPPGKGGVIIHDSIGGDQFQFRTSGAMPGYTRVVLFRKAPADGMFTVTLGLAGYGEVRFDDFRVQVIQGRGPSPRPDPDLAQDRRTRGESPGLPDPRVPADTASRPNEERQPR